MSLMKEDNIFRDHLSIEEIKARLERNIDAVYIVDDAYEEGVGGWYNLNSRNIYVKAENPNELKEFLKRVRKNLKQKRRCLKRLPSFFVMLPVYYPFLYLKHLWSSQLLLFEK